MRRASLVPLALLAATWWTPGPRGTAAQVIEVPTFEVAAPTFEPLLRDVDVAVGTDGNLCFIWTEFEAGTFNLDKAITRVFSPQGTALATNPVRADTSAHVNDPVISADPRGGYVAGWEWVISNKVYSFYGQRLDSTGAPRGIDFKIEDDLAFPGHTGGGAVAGLPSGSIFVWTGAINTLWGRLYDADGLARGGSFAVGDATFFDVDVDAMPDGGFVAVSTDSFAEALSWGRVYRADGQPRGAAFPIGTDFSVKRVAASPFGGFAVAGTRYNTTVACREVWVRRFNDDGVFLGETLVETPASGIVLEPDLAFDAYGDIYVVWSGFVSQNGQPVRPRARGLDPGGTPLGEAFFVGDDPIHPIRTARLANGTRFVNTWTRSGKAWANVVSLCAPDTTVCGDGIIAAQCEQCDDGATNSDTAPDACRTNCRLPRCGDSVVDSAEECDDGNNQSCDGCSASCQLEVGFACGDGIIQAACNEECDDGAANSDTAPDTCRANCHLPRCGDGVVDSVEECDDGNSQSCDGCSVSCRQEPGLGCGDGVVAPGCGETCDDGNQTTGDGCSGSCTLERIPGRGSPTTDCYAEWSVNNPANIPLRDAYGNFNYDQRCTDDDPRCDFDGGTPGSCTFSVRLCVNNTDVLGCTPPNRIANWMLTKPSAAKALVVPPYAQLRANFAAAAAPLIGPTDRDLCGDVVPVVVPLRGVSGSYHANKLTLKAVALLYSGEEDKDALKLTCLP